MPRDTDADWVEIGKAQPFFGVLSNEKYLAQNLDDEAVAEFYESGRADISSTIAKLSQMQGRPFTSNAAIDFGCGTGRLSLAMARHSSVVHGVDVSPAMLEVAAQQAGRSGITNVKFVRSIPDVEVDWVNSLIVFQHIPPRRGINLLEELLRHLRPGGAISLQLTFFKDRSHMGELQRDLAEYRYDGESVQLLTTAQDNPPGAMTMYDYDLNAVLSTVFMSGIGELVVHHTNHSGCHGVYLFGFREA